MSELIFGNKTVVTLQRPMDLTENDINDIIVGAIEGGINYWGFIGAETKIGKPSKIATSDWCTRILLDGGKVRIVDREDPTEWEDLTLDKLVDGIKMNMVEVGRYELDDYDAEDYDRIIQYALFGKLIYG